MSGSAARDYSDKLTLTDRFHAPLLEQITVWLEVAAGSFILDAGCGAGGMTALLAHAAASTGTVAALDSSQGHLEATRGRTEGLTEAASMSFYQGSADALPFADKSFDLVWCSHVLHGFGELQPSLREFYRVLDSSGRLAVREDFSAQRFLPFELGVTRPGLEDRIRAFYASQYALWHDRTPYRAGWPIMLRDAGFETVRAKTFLLEQLPPLTADQHLYLSELLASWRTDEALREALEPDDRASLSALTDPTSPDYGLSRADLYLLDEATLYLGSR